MIKLHYRLLKKSENTNNVTFAGILLRKKNKEDLDINGIIIPLGKRYAYYNDAFNDIRAIIISDKFVGHLIEKFHLINNLFEGDQTYHLSEINWQENNIMFLFQNDINQKEFDLQIDYIDIFSREEMNDNE